MGSDFFFRMGSTHAVCQDYALAGQARGCHYAIVSDGCSGLPIAGEPGSPYTDYGARFLARAAQQNLPRISEGEFPAMDIITAASDVAYLARLPNVALDATLIVAATTPSDDVVVFQTGDGVVASRDLDGTIHYQTLSFGNGMPYYLSYVRDPRRREALFRPQKGDVAPEVAEAAGTLEVTIGLYRPQEGWSTPVVRNEAFDETTPVERMTRFRREQTDLVLIMSDGVESFQLKDGTTVPLEQVLEQLFAFKGFAGQFLVRRCNRFLQKFCADNGWHHSDDFGVAGIYMGAK
jgi:hypothetical protein